MYKGIKDIIHHRALKGGRQFNLMEKESIASIIQKQRELFESNRTKDVKFRLEQLNTLKKVIKKNEAAMYMAVYSDFAKSEFDTFMTELSMVYHEINLALKYLKEWCKPRKVASSLLHFPAKSYIYPEPLGTVLVIGAWNYPLQLCLVPAISALAAGNTVILKPGEQSAESSRILAAMINSNFPDDYFHVIEGAADVSSQLLNHRFDKIFFTGSATVGRIIYKAAAEHLTPVTLELGGKSPAFVFRDANIRLTAKRLVWAKFLNAGQTCVAPDYILVEKSVEGVLLEAIKSEIKRYYKECSLTENYTQIINDRHFERLSKLIDSGDVYCGGTRKAEIRFISPTVMYNVSFDDEVMKEEIFGPVLPVIAFEDIDVAIKAVKDRPKPLSAYVYTNNRKIVKKLIKEVSFGGGAINDSVMNLSNSNLPFGGVGLSGIGSYHGKTGFDTFSHFKSIYRNSFRFEPPLKYPPYTKAKLRLIRFLMR